MQVAHGITQQNVKESRKVEEKVERKAEVKTNDEDAQQKEETAKIVAPRKRTHPKTLLVLNPPDAGSHLQANQIDHYAGNGPKPGKKKG